MTQYGFHFDGSRCTGCKTCMLACKDYNDLSSEVAFRQIYEYGEGTWTADDSGAWTTDAYTYYLSTACNHCDSPACFAACPTGAINKDPDNGIVRIDQDVCVGDGACVKACPYNVPIIDPEKGKGRKCDLCYDRVTNGQQPICVEACPLRALDFGEIEDLRAKYGDTADIAPLPDPSQTMPNVVITAPAHAKKFNEDAGEILNVGEIV